MSCLSTCIFPDKTSYPIDETMVGRLKGLLHGALTYAIGLLHWILTYTVISGFYIGLLHWAHTLSYYIGLLHLALILGSYIELIH